MDRISISSTLQPMTISMIKKGMKNRNLAQLDYVISEGHSINNIVIVGFSVELLINNEQEEFQCLIEDSTGNILVITPLSQQYPNWLEKIIKENPKQPSYVRCIIKPKQFKQEIVFQCVFMELIKNFNVITLHLLDCIKAYNFRKSFSQNTQLDQNQEQNILIKQKSISHFTQIILKLLEKGSFTKEEISQQLKISQIFLIECLEQLKDSICICGDDEQKITLKQQL